MSDFSFDLTRCRICPRQCGADRRRTCGVCGADATVRVAKVMLHHWEEPCISGNDKSRGSGAVFFGGCPLKCVFCQNAPISRGTVPMEEYTPEKLSRVIRRLENEGAYNINLVSPTQYLPQIIEALDLYKPKIPVVFNTGGYERPRAIEKLRGYADIFLTDFKYGSADTARRYSAAPDYTDYAKKALAAMVSVAGKPQFSSDGMMKSGVIVRHLILPGERHDSIAALNMISQTVDTDDVLLSLMSQYTPDFAPKEIRNLNRRITTFEYETVRSAALSLGFSGYSQDAASAVKAYTPDF